MENSQIQSGTKVDNGVQMFNTVSTRLEKLNISNTLDSMLEKLNKNIVEKNNHKISSEEFEILGGISYLVGLDFYSMSSWSSKTMTNVVLRLLINKITNQNFLKYFQYLVLFKEEYSFSVISDARLEMMDKIKSRLTLGSDLEELEFIKKFRNVINNSLIPIEISEDLYQRFFDKDYLSYHDLLVFNSFAYNESILNSESSKAFIDLSNDSNYINGLNLASDYFELQKFGLFYEESILNFFNKNIENNNQLFSYEFFNDFLNDENIELVKDNTTHSSFIEKIENYFVTNIQPNLDVEAPVSPLKFDEPVKTPLSDGIETLNENIENPLDKPTEVIKHILFDFNKIRNDNNLAVFDFKNKPEDLISLLEEMLDVEDLISSFYTFLSKYNEFKRTPDVIVNPIDISQIFNYDLETLNKSFDTKVKDLQNKYTSIIEKYVIEIPENDLKILVDSVNTLLNKLYIGNSEDKGIILSQLNENTIWTYKHLHQIISTIENQYIDGFSINSYIIFKALMEENYFETMNLFQESQNLEQYELKIKLLHTFVGVFN